MKKIIIVMTLVFLLSMSVLADSLEENNDYKQESSPNIAMQSITVKESVQGVTIALRVIDINMVDVLKMRLQLNDVQTSNVKNILETESEKMRPLIREHLIASQNFAVELSSEKYDEDKLTKAAVKLMEIEKTILFARLEAFGKLRAMLTDEQQKKFAELMKSYTVIWQSAFIEDSDSNNKYIDEKKEEEKN